MEDLVIDQLQGLKLNDQNLNELKFDFDTAVIKVLFSVFNERKRVYNLFGYTFNGARNLSISHVCLDDFTYLEVFSQKVEKIDNGMYTLKLQLYQGPNNPSGFVSFDFLECQSH